MRVRVRVLTVRDEKKSKRRRGVMGLIFFLCALLCFCERKGGSEISVGESVGL